MADVLEVHADLMRAPRFQTAFDQGGTSVALEHAVGSACRLAAMRDSHACSRPDVAADRRVDYAARRRVALHHGEVEAAHRARGKLLDELVLRSHGLRNHE